MRKSTLNFGGLLSRMERRAESQKPQHFRGQFESRVNAFQFGILAFWRTTLGHRQNPPENATQIDNLSAKGYTWNYGGALLWPCQKKVSELIGLRGLADFTARDLSL